MENIIGQTKLKAILSNYTIATMPATLLLIGDTGSGKTHICAQLAKHLGLELVELSDKTSAEELIDFQQCPITKLYHLDLCTVTEKAQNKFLKFIEEPASTVKIVLEATSEVGVLQTILNRCFKLTLEPYTNEELQAFSWAPKNADSLVYKFYNTPGKLNTLGNAKCFEELKSICNMILTKFPMLPKSEFANAMTLSTKFQAKKDIPVKLEFNIFLDVFIDQAFEYYKQTGELFAFSAYTEAQRLKKQLINKTVSKDVIILKVIL